MKKFYCFNCQQEVEPKKIFGFGICPHCYRRIMDSGDGFYRICDKCGADNPVSARSCIKCKSNLSGEFSPDDTALTKADSLLNILLEIAIFIIGTVLLFFALYLSFYIFFAVAIFGAIFWLVSKTIGRIR